MKILIAIANHGTKNQKYVEKVIAEYRSLPYQTDIIVISNIQKNFGPDIKVEVQQPPKGLWSLPFLHRKILADNLNNYDLFIYSEDDTLIEKKNIDAFLKISEVLPKDKIAGFLRYECDDQGNKYCCTIHSHFHWIAGSVCSYDRYKFAKLTNAHSAAYMLTREQLAKAIESGGYLVEPHEGRYDMLCSAATDPYTQCGFEKVICISDIDDFMLHHLPNHYIGNLGLDYKELQVQLKALFCDNSVKNKNSELFPTVTKLNKQWWDKLYYSKCRGDLFDLIPSACKSVLSVGCGWGLTEAELIKRGFNAAAIPLDAVVAESAKMRGIEVLSPDFEDAKKELGQRKFDCILLTDVLAHLPEPGRFLEEYSGFLSDDGCMLITSPNFKFLRYNREINNRTADKSFDKTSIHLTTKQIIMEWVKKGGLNLTEMRYNFNRRFNKISKLSFGLMNQYLGREIILLAKSRQKQIKVCMLGASFETGNLGVSALAESSIKCILNRWPDAQITLLEGATDSNSFSLSISGGDIKMNVFTIRFCKNIFVRHHFLKLAFYALLAKLSLSKKFREKIISKDQCLKHISESDYVIDINAGDSFSDLYGKRRFLLGFLRKWLVLIMGKKLVFLPQTYGPFRSAITAFLAKWLVKHSAAAYARDKAGFNYLTELLGANENGHKVRLLPDIAFILDAHRPDNLERDFPALLKTDNRPVVGLNISGLLYRGGYNESNMFGLRADYKKLVEGIIKLLVEDCRAQIILVPHVFPPPRFEIESDLSACMDLCRSIDKKYLKNIFLVRKRYSHNEMKYIIGRCDFFVGARMHSCIAAISQSIPTIGLAYSDKFSGIFENVGLEENVIEMRSAANDEILRKIKEGFNSRDEISEKLKVTIPKIKKDVLSLDFNACSNVMVF
ncbi:MAG: polysaccharide pyruvyl transferase family protein [Sedimentisphaerales bacterium]|nr:polysaccharide pyruvyl transferase family protein [Sedimentisphaerales bacterium]